MYSLEAIWATFRFPDVVTILRGAIRLVNSLDTPRRSLNTSSAFNTNL